jgi:glycosyltransferase involved in cell wall biosynthesis
MHSAAPTRVLALSKRQYMGRDLIDDRYGRFRELPLALARLGMQVEGICLSYRPRAEARLRDCDGAACVEWTALGVRRLLSLGTAGYWREVDRVRERLAPGVVWAGSDVPHLELGRRVARRLGSAFACDLYDNFESYPIARVPGMGKLLRRAIAAADAVACISAPLAERVRTRYHYSGLLEVVENAVPAGTFQPMQRAQCRARFGLPAEARLVGTAGALTPTRGTGLLLEAFAGLAEERDDLHLVLAGPLDRALRLPSHPRLHYLGSLPPRQVPQLLCALDLSVICNRDSAFGRFCFPQKLYESLACAIPVVAASVGAVAQLLGDWPRNLYRPDDLESLRAALRTQLDSPSLPALSIPTWDSQARRLAGLLEGALA